MVYLGKTLITFANITLLEVLKDRVRRFTADLGKQ